MYIHNVLENCPWYRRKSFRSTAVIDFMSSEKLMFVGSLCNQVFCLDGGLRFVRSWLPPNPCASTSLFHEIEIATESTCSHYRSPNGFHWTLMRKCAKDLTNCEEVLIVNGDRLREVKLKRVSQPQPLHHIHRQGIKKSEEKPKLSTLTRLHGETKDTPADRYDWPRTTAVSTLIRCESEESIGPSACRCGTVDWDRRSRQISLFLKTMNIPRGTSRDRNETHARGPCFGV